MHRLVLQLLQAEPELPVLVRERQPHRHTPGRFVRGRLLRQLSSRGAAGLQRLLRHLDPHEVIVRYFITMQRDVRSVQQSVLKGIVWLVVAPLANAIPFVVRRSWGCVVHVIGFAPW